MQGDWRAFQWASGELQNDVEFVKEALTFGGQALQYASADVRGGRSVVLDAVQLDGLALQHAFYGAHKSDREIVAAAVRQTWRALPHANAEFHGDKELALL